jgi:hypothetical protein
LTFSFEKYAEDIADEKSPDIGWMEYPDYVDPGNNSLSYNPTEFCGKSIACKIKRDYFGFFMHFIQHCFICRPPNSTVSEDAGIEPQKD